MALKYFIIVAGILFGIGIGSVFLKRNLLSILLAMSTACWGIMIVMGSLLSQFGPSKDGELFLLGIMTIQSFTIIIGCGVIYRRQAVTGTTNIDEGNFLQR